VLWVVVLGLGCGRPAGTRERAHDVERRILAPCCKRQTLEDHESELARALRAEIERRIDGGEQAVAIEEDLVRRYGEDVRAMPGGRDPRALLGLALAGALGLGGLAVLWLVRRKRAPAGAPAPRDRDAADDNAAYEERLDDELVAVD